MKKIRKAIIMVLVAVSVCCSVIACGRTKLSDSEIDKLSEKGYCLTKYKDDTYCYTEDNIQYYYKYSMGHFTFTKYKISNLYNKYNPNITNEENAYIVVSKEKLFKYKVMLYKVIKDSQEDKSEVDNSNWFMCKKDVDKKYLNGWNDPLAKERDSYTTIMNYTSKNKLRKTLIKANKISKKMNKIV
ncbi:hypothetical protein [Lachnobacterium bovis]|uniref:DUF4367 domain-containing protein n=1 Tax=Lachnobacterium bovis DSM 14045 TaxID=1122142 RepID=A0A1H3N993_9FIRM|nr:hypothetical protein [Lachnobacterium bovis]SDY84779.1 hypothetical protein SAMN02910414_02493 [Lachnobacterium bovis DSM 14045]